MKVFISKYALSGGITEHECNPPIDDRNMVYPGYPFAKFYGFKLGVDAHNNRQDAIDASNKMRDKRIDSLRKQISKLEKMKF